MVDPDDPDTRQHLQMLVVARLLSDVTGPDRFAPQSVTIFTISGIVQSHLNSSVLHGMFIVVTTEG